MKKLLDFICILIKIVYIALILWLLARLTLGFIASPVLLVSIVILGLTKTTYIWHNSSFLSLYLLMIVISVYSFIFFRYWFWKIIQWIAYEIKLLLKGEY